MQTGRTSSSANVVGMTRALNRSLPFWILLAASAGLVAAGIVTVLDHLGTMTATLKDGSATGLEVYAGQSWIVIGAALLGAGALGILLALALVVISALLGAATAAPAVVAPLASDDEDHEPDDLDPETALDASAAPHEILPEPEQDGSASSSDETATGSQNGSSGSTATATKISVR